MIIYIKRTIILKNINFTKRKQVLLIILEIKNSLVV